MYLPIDRYKPWHLADLVGALAMCGADTGARERFFAATRECRRRDTVDVHNTAVSACFLFAHEDEHVLRAVLAATAVRQTCRLVPSYMCVCTQCAC